MKITIEIDDEKCTVESASGILLNDVLQLLTQALLGVGFVFDGELTIAEGDEQNLDG